MTGFQEQAGQEQQLIEPWLTIFGVEIRLRDQVIAYS